MDDRTFKSDSFATVIPVGQRRFRTVAGCLVLTAVILIAVLEGYIRSRSPHLYSVLKSVFYFCIATLAIACLLGILYSLRPRRLFMLTTTALEFGDGPRSRIVVSWNEVHSVSIVSKSGTEFLCVFLNSPHQTAGGVARSAPRSC